MRSPPRPTIEEQLNRALRSAAWGSSTLLVFSVLYLMWTLNIQATFKIGFRWSLFGAHVKGVMRMTTMGFALLAIGLTTHGWAWS